MANYKGRPPNTAAERAAAEKFAGRLESARKLAGHESRAAGARALGVEIPRYERWERGEREPGVFWLARIQTIFSVPLEKLIPPAPSQHHPKRPPPHARLIVHNPP